MTSEWFSELSPKRCSLFLWVPCNGSQWLRKRAQRSGASPCRHVHASYCQWLRNSTLFPFHLIQVFFLSCFAAFLKLVFFDITKINAPHRFCTENEMPMFISIWLVIYFFIPSFVWLKWLRILIFDTSLSCFVQNFKLFTYLFTFSADAVKVLFSVFNRLHPPPLWNI